MTVIDKKVRRDVIPRWRLSAAKLDLDALPAKRKKVELSLGPQQDPASLLREFHASRKPLFASEALSSALALGDRGIAVEAAKALSGFDLSARPALADQVKMILADGSSPDRSPAPSLEVKAKSQIQRFKRIVRGYPRSPLAWLDLAFAYSAVGQLEQAKSAVLAAVSLEPNHRAVVRSASRFFVHKGEFDRALSVISRSELLQADPWLVSAHIATARAAGTSSRLIGSGRKMFKDTNFRSDQISELGAALATTELEHGNRLLAQKLVSRALVEPTENAVAQVGWLEATGGANFDVAGMAEKLPTAWEARTFELFERGEWRKSCEQAKQWLCDQPFSSRPAVHGSYVAATFLEDYELSLAFAEAGYRANPTDIVVANNYAVALAETGRLAEARRVFADAMRSPDPNWRWTLRATEGLLLYREGDVEGARAAYQGARRHFSEQSDKRSELLASVYQAREELRLGNSESAKELVAPLASLATDSRFADHEALKKVAAGIKFDRPN